MGEVSENFPSFCFVRMFIRIFTSFSLKSLSKDSELFISHNMQTHHVPMSLCNSTFVMQFEDRVPAALGRIEPQRFSTTVTQLNRMIVDGTPRKLVLGFLITMLLLTVMVIVFTSVGYPMAIYVHIALVFVLTIPYGIYAFRCQTKV